jgi:hypothetical protein
MDPNKLECFIIVGWKGLPGTNTQAYYAHSEAMEKRRSAWTELSRKQGQKF